MHQRTLPVIPRLTVLTGFKSGNPRQPQRGTVTGLHLQHLRHFAGYFRGHSGTTGKEQRLGQLGTNLGRPRLLLHDIAVLSDRPFNVIAHQQALRKYIAAGEVLRMGLNPLLQALGNTGLGHHIRGPGLTRHHIAIQREVIVGTPVEIKPHRTEWN